ncbi:MAG: nucleotidyltransferase domain-containing protein [Tetrasphaera sp.]
MRWPVPRSGSRRWGRGGPWVDGGAWLRVDGHPVDWIYRDLTRVQESIDEALAGRFGWHHQTGHPLGVPSFLYAAELATGRILSDPSGRLAAAREAVVSYPPTLAERVIEGGLWESGFTLEIAAKAAARGDVDYVAGCLFRAVLLLAHVIHARAGVWLTNEKGAMTAADRLRGAPPDFAARAVATFTGLDSRREDLESAIDAARRLRADVSMVDVAS